MLLNIFFLIYSAVTLILSYFFYHLNQTINLFLIDLVALLLFSICAFFLIKSKMISLRFDVILSVFSFLILSVYFGSVVLRFNNGLRFPIVSTWDAAVHFSMMKEAMEQKKLLLAGAKRSAINYEYPEEQKGKKLYYPPAFYLTSAVLGLHFIPTVSKSETPIFLINWFYFMNIFLIGLSFLSFFYLLKEFVQVYRKKFSPVLAFLYTFFLFFGVVQLSNLFLGFSSFIIFIVFFNCSLFFLLRLQKRPNYVLYSLFLLSLYLAITSWFLLLLPILLISLIPFLKQSMAKDRVCWFIFFLFLCLILYFVFLFIYPSFNFSRVSKTLAFSNGAVQEFDLLVIILFSFLSFIFFKNKKRRKKVYSVFFAFLSLLLILVGLFSFQILSAGQPAYYLKKAFVIVFEIMLVISFYFFSELFFFLLKNFEIDVGRRWKNLSFALKKIFLLLIFSFFFCLIGFKAIVSEGELSYFRYLKTEPLLNREHYNIIFSLDKKYNLEEYMTAVFPVQFNTTLWVGALYGRNLPFFEPFSDSKVWNDDAEVLKMKFINYLLEENSRYKILIIDLTCFFNPSEKEFIKVINPRVEFYPSRCK